MDLKELRKKVLNDVTHCYLMKGSKIYELDIRVFKKEKDVSDIYETEPYSFTIGFENPNNKKIFKPDYAIPFIDVMGIDDNGKLILTDYTKGGFDVPNAPMTIQGDFFLTREDAEKAINPIKPTKQVDTKALIIDKINNIKDYANNCLYSEDIDYFDEITDEILELIKSI